MQRVGDHRTRMSYLPDLNDYEQNDPDEEDDKDRGPDEEFHGWDVFKHFPLKLKTGSSTSTKFFDRAAQFAKFTTYIVLLVLTVGCGVLAKLTIIFAVSQIDDDGPMAYCDYNDKAGRPSGRKLSAELPNNSRIAWYWCVIFAFAFAEFLGLLSAIYCLLFKKRSKLKKRYIALLMIVECIHTVGLALLFLVVLPELNSIQAVVVSSCTCLVPGLLGILSRGNKQYPCGKSMIILFCDIGAFVGQLFGTFVWLFTDDYVIMTSQTRWILPIALLMTSCRWWGNYVSSCSKFGFVRHLSRIKEKLEAGRGITQGFSAACRIIVFFVTSILIAYGKGIKIASLFDKSIVIGKYTVSLVYVSSVSSTMESPLLESISINEGPAGFFTINSYYLPLLVFVTHVASSFIVYSSGKFAYRTMMQGYGFALPVNIIVPATVGTIIMISALRDANTCVFHKLLPDYVFFDVPDNIGNLSDLLNHWYPWIWLVTVPSQAWITLHIWSPHSERLATTEHIFVVPTYDSLIIDQSMVLNRRIDEIPDDSPRTEKLESSDEPATETIYSNPSSKSVLSEIELNDRVTRIIVCATMWHETEDEMTEFVGSILRLDMNQGTKRFTQGYYNLRMQDYYELEKLGITNEKIKCSFGKRRVVTFEAHIFFDDAFRCMHGCKGSCKHDEEDTQVNDYVMCLINTMEKSIERLHILAIPPKKYPSPYGGRLEWTLPGKTTMIVHLKDKNRIRHRKRWSQVMYMYYLLGYCLMDTPISKERKQIIAENTYLLTLDGDIDFRPSAVKVLVDLMKRDKDLGAACGRIHPIGTGPMVWFQKFEYAIGHWLQKSTEHTIGSVLCSPGAFSLFRARALMEHNVMRKYATESTEPMHYVQYDQGEDRWLCTLILQVGYRVEYSAASDSYTHAPETFNEFYNQRRRWIPSTIANIFDLLSTSGETRKANDDISWLYIAYQWVLMGSTVLGPGTIFLMLVGAFVAAFRIDNWSSFGYNLIPIVIFVVVCVTCKANIQLIVAGMITAFYGLVMIVVLVGIMIQIAEDGWVAPSTILFFVVACQLVIAGLLHPQELSCLLCGLIYYVTVPSMYMLLIIFALFNVNNVTWGTRDSGTTVEQASEKTRKGDEKKNGKSTNNGNIRDNSVKNHGAIEFSLAGLFKCILCTKDGKTDDDDKLDLISKSLERITSRLDAMEKNSDADDTQKNRRNEKFGTRSKQYDDDSPINSRIRQQSDSEEYTDNYDDDNDNDDHNNDERVDDIYDNDSDIYGDGSNRGAGNFLVNPYWLQDEKLRKGGVEFLSREEEHFWERLIEKYLHPIEEDKEKMEKTSKGLKDLRDEYIFKFFMLNALFVLIVFLMQLHKDILYLEWPLGETYNITYVMISNEVHIEKTYLKLEPIGCLFIIGFVVILGVQFIAMLFHRFNTFSHILANTTIKWPWCKKPTDINDEADMERHADDIANGLQQVIEHNAESILGRKASAVPPGKRQTVCELAESQDRRVKLPANLDTLFDRNLNDSRSELSRFMTTQMPPNIFEAFGRRHSTMVADNRKQTRLNVNNQNGSIYNSPGNNVASTSRQEANRTLTRENSYVYDNGTFVSDDYGHYGEDKASEDDVSMPRHRPSQVTFGDIGA